MSDVSDSALLHSFIREGSQQAFAEIVSRHAGWIHAAAMRTVRDSHLADDVTQAVFIVLAKKAAHVKGESLGPWLFRATRYACSHTLRERKRRLHHEREASAMKQQSTPPPEPPLWERIAPILDELVQSLSPAMRGAILLRFYQQKHLADVGKCLGISEDAARKRVAKATSVLRAKFARRGILVAAEDFAVALAARVSPPVPPGIIASCSSAPAQALGQISGIAKGAITSMFTIKAKVAAIILVLLALIPATTAVFILG